MAGRKRGWGGSRRRAADPRERTRAEGGAGESAGGGSFRPLHHHTHLADPASPRLGAGSALLPPSACWASGRPQTPLATTHRHATRAPSRRRRSRLQGTARAPSGQTEGLEGAITAGGREAGARNLGGCGAWEGRPAPASRMRSRFRARETQRAEFWEM